MYLTASRQIHLTDSQKDRIILKKSLRKKGKPLKFAVYLLSCLKGSV